MSHWESLLAVQAHDTRLDQLTHRLETLPERTQLARLADEVAEVDRQLAVVDERRGELSRSQSRLEDEVTSLTARADQAEKQLYSRAVSNPRELQALQDDVASIRRRIGQIEDDELEIMELSEPVEAQRESLAARRASLEAAAVQARGALARAEAEIEAERAEVQAARATAAAEVPEELWPEYEALRRRLGGVAIARLVGSTCQGCHLALPAVEVDRIRRLSPDEPVHCEECGRLLVRD
ncbi:MAG TPA: C4-type zinc ribbon domain-containing protein [Acidimicrobiales bacterium]|nr:C4-type zinc ribbon domain-containing protein [Acidimicrobiales bacterium]